MKLIKLITLLSASAFLLCSCDAGKYLKRPDDTNLELWITEIVGIEKLREKGCQLVPAGIFGAALYLGSKYELIEPANDNLYGLPEYYVTYFISGYPDLSDHSAVTNIEITDPEVTVYGLTINSTLEEAKARLGNKATYEELENGFYFKMKPCGFYFTDKEKIDIRAPESTNHFGIIY